MSQNSGDRWRDGVVAACAVNINASARTQCLLVGTTRHLQQVPGGIYRKKNVQNEGKARCASRGGESLIVKMRITFRHCRFEYTQLLYTRPNN